MKINKPICSWLILSGVITAATLSTPAHADCKDLGLALIHSQSSPAELAKQFLKYEKKVDDLVWKIHEKKKSFKVRGDYAAGKISELKADLESETYNSGGIVGQHYNCDIEGSLDVAYQAAIHYNFKTLNQKLEDAKDALKSSRKLADHIAKGKRS